MMAVAGFFCLSASAQYPQLTDEAKQLIEQQKKQWKAHSDSAWAVAFPIVIEEAKAGRPYVPWAARPYDLRQAKIPAFPGAEGGGMYTFGGRGGKVLTVTNLNDDGPGSFRWACEQGIIVFNVSGIIRLKSPIYVRAPYITIAGQTAPGDGVIIAGESFQVDTYDVIVRHMRFRRGETLVTNREDSFGGNPVGNIMIDHCSCEWGLDENITARAPFTVVDSDGATGGGYWQMTGVEINKPDDQNDRQFICTASASALVHSADMTYLGYDDGSVWEHAVFQSTCVGQPEEKLYPGDTVHMTVQIQLTEYYTKGVNYCHGFWEIAGVTCFGTRGEHVGIRANQATEGDPDFSVHAAECTFEIPSGEHSTKKAMIIYSGCETSTVWYYEWVSGTP